MKELLLTLCQIPAVSGREDSLREFIIKKIAQFCEYRVDPLGNIICFKQGKQRAKKKIMLDAHMDEVGIIASSITSDGFIKFQTVGGIDPAVMLCRSVRFESGTVGVVGCKPVHLSSSDERKRLPDAESLYIDIGAEDKAQAEKLVSIGDTAVFESAPVIMGGRLKARAIDDRVGVACLMKLLLSESEYDFYATFSVQEEVGLRGAKAAAFSVDPDAAIILEATTASDLYGVSDDKTVCRLGSGPAISFMDRATLYDRRLFDAVGGLGLKYQVKTTVAGGNNAGAVHLSKNGVPTVTVSLPCRYIHSPSCVAQLSDLEDMLKLSESLLCELAEGKIL